MKFKKDFNTVAILIIGNEILSGKTQDSNLNFIAKRCNHLGYLVKEVRVVRDDEKQIIKALKDLSKLYIHVFTTGGIGPTHDDITAECVAKAFKRKLVLNKKAHKLLINHYKNSNIELNESRLKMAMIPKNAKLIKNSVSSAPGFKIKNVWVLAGVPKIMQAMFLEDIEPKLNKGKKYFPKALKYLSQREILLSFYQNYNLIIKILI